MTSQVFFGVLIATIFLFGLITMQKNKDQAEIDASDSNPTTETFSESK